MQERRDCEGRVPATARGVVVPPPPSFLSSWSDLAATRSPTLKRAVPWALRGFTAGFGMEPGGARALWPPGRIRSSFRRSVLRTGACAACCQASTWTRRPPPASRHGGAETPWRTSRRSSEPGVPGDRSLIPLAFSGSFGLWRADGACAPLGPRERPTIEVAVRRLFGRARPDRPARRPGGTGLAFTLTPSLSLEGEAEQVAATRGS